VREHRWQLSLDCPESAFHVQIKVKVAGSQATSNGLSHPQSSVLLAIFQWCASDYGCWALRIYENENDGCHGHQIGPKQPKAKANKSRWVGPQDPFGWVGLEKVANAITTMQSSLLCLYILAMIFSALFTHVAPSTWPPLPQPQP